MSSDKEIRVKFAYRSSLADENSPYKFQTPQNSGKLNNCFFSFNPLEKDYDWLVVIDDIAKIVPNRIENLSCPKENTILVTTEPSSITRYGRAFAQQFQYLITNQPSDILPHPNSLRSHTGNLWMYGENYDVIKKQVPMKKTKKISTICSNKQQGHTAHARRFEFTKKMEEEIAVLERFGRGFKWIDKKAEALDNYEFHVCIENHIGENVWTEKLADAFLGYTVPIYCGCPNIYDYFPKDSLIQIDINDFDKSIKIIQDIINTPGEYERRLTAVIEARRRVIEEYNLLAMIVEIVQEAKPAEFKLGQKIYSRRLMRVRYCPDLFRYFRFRIENFLKNIRFH